MKFHRKQKIKRFYKKSIWPSIILFLVFLGSCTGMVLTCMFTFQAYLINTKIADMHEDARNLGRMVDQHTQENNETIFEAVSFIQAYLEEDKDICITDADDQVLKYYGKTMPDFGRAENVQLINPYQLIPDLNMAGGERQLLLTFPELLWRSIEALKKSSYEDNQWMDEPLFHTYYWVEVPIRMQDYHLYYRGSMTIVQKNIFFMNRARIPATLVVG